MNFVLRLGFLIVFWGFFLSGGLALERSPIQPFLNGSLPATTPATGVDGSITWEAVSTMPNLVLPVYNPMHLLPVPGTSDLLLMGDQTGKLFSIVNDSLTTTPNLILDLEPNTQYFGDSGLMGVVFHPDYGKPGSNNHSVFVFYRWIPEVYEPDPYNFAYVRISKFEWIPGASTIDPASEVVLINHYDFHNWHQGGGMAFGDDGFLYIALGDQGNANDLYDTAQKLDEGLFAGVLRIDVDMDPTKSHPIRRQPISLTDRPPGWTETTYTGNYFVPNDNPFLDPGGGVLEEYYAVGLRNPYRMTRDPLTNRFWIGDVGQGDREEINVLEKGGNYQWPYMEGTRVATKPKPAANVLIGQEVPPLFEYGRDIGGCVIGGYVYRGSLNPELYGKYIFAEYNLGKVYALDEGDGLEPVQIIELLSLPPYLMLGFGLDHQGEIYVTKRAEGEGGLPAELLRIQKTSGQITSGFAPTLLSLTGAFSDLETLQPVDGVVPYDVVQPLWSDGAEKKRWLSVPKGTGVLDDKIDFSEQGNWDFPAGTVLIKHFELGGKRVETRFTVFAEDDTWYGLNYRWNEDETEAFLLTGENGTEITIDIAGETKKWYFPSRNECFTCHTSSKGRVLGVSTRHLNRDLTYSPIEISNQLVALNDAGYFSGSLSNDAFPNMLTAAAIDDITVPKEKRVRSYLDINCSHCHSAGSIPRARFEADLGTPLFWQNLINANPVNNLGNLDAKVIDPGDETSSVLYQRASSLEGCCAMPPLAKNEVDNEALAVFAGWIQGLNPNEGPTGNVDPTQSTGDITPPTGSVKLGVNVNELVLQFDEPMEGLDIDDFVVTNGLATDLVGTGDSRILTIAPEAEGDVNISIPLDSFHDTSGNANAEAIAYQYQANSKGGFNYTYHEGSFSLLPDFASLPVVKSGQVAELDLSPRLVNDNFAMRFTGFLTIETPGSYQFFLESDDGSRLVIDGLTVVDNDGLHGNVLETGSVTLAAGGHQFVVEYFESLGQETLNLEVSGPDYARGEIPAGWISSQEPEETGPAQITQSINGSALPGRISSTDVMLTVDIGVSTNVAADLVVDLVGSGNWYGGGRVRVMPGSSVATISVPIINLPAEGDSIVWHVFLAEPGGGYATGTYFSDLQDVELSDDPVLAPATDYVGILAAPPVLRPKSSGTVNVKYEAVTDGYLQLSLTGDDGRWISGDSVFVAAGTGVKIVPIWIPEGETGSFNYNTFVSSAPWDWQTARVWGAVETGQISSDPITNYALAMERPVIMEGQPQRVSYSYSSEAAKEIVIEIFNKETHSWAAGTRIQVAPGIDSSSKMIDVSGLPAGTYQSYSFLVVPGGEWTIAEMWVSLEDFTIEAAPVADP